MSASVVPRAPTADPWRTRDPAPPTRPCDRRPHRSLQADPSIGLLLPCNVVIRRTDSGTVVEMIDPQMLVEVTENPDMVPIAREVGDRLAAALATVRGTA